MRKFVAKNLLRSRLLSLREHISAYERQEDVVSKLKIQCELFNAHWEYASKKVPFYMAWKDEYNLPERIENISDLDNFPILTKEILLERDTLVRLTPDIERFTLTGGTSGTSVAFPMNSADHKTSWNNTYLGRYWNIISPGDRLFMIWGHSHLFAGKWARHKQVIRRLKDWGANIDRRSAYNLNSAALDIMADEITRTRPAYLIGYGSCLAQLAHYLYDSGRDLANAGVQRVVNTSETMDALDAPIVEKVFCCPVINEYGSAEAGVIGYSSASLYPIKIFWRDFILRNVNHKIILTTVGNRCFPLINYDTEDLTNDTMPDTSSIFELNTLSGKARDIFKIVDSNGQEHEVSVILFDHILKQLPAIRSLHYALNVDGKVKIDYTTNKAYLEESFLIDFLLRGLSQEGIKIKREMISFQQIVEPKRTKAGKRLKVSYE